MVVKTFCVNPLSMNCYLLSDDDTKEGVIIDCGCSTDSEWRNIKTCIEREGITLRHLLCTHMHFDHIWGINYVKRDFNLYPEGSADDLPIFNMAQQMVDDMCGFHMPLPPMPAPKNFLHDGDIIKFGNSELKVIATPGHSPGGICFYSAKDNILIAGDTIFCNSVGRADLEGGNFATLINSIRKKIMTLPPSTQIYCGHGPMTTVENEEMYNPYL